MLQRGHSGDGCDLSLTLRKYDMKKGDPIVLSWQGCDELGGKVSLQTC